MELVGFDGPTSLQMGERPEQPPSPHEVRVRLRNMALNHLDVFITRGLPKRPLPAILGSDGAGVGNGEAVMGGSGNGAHTAGAGFHRGSTGITCQNSSWLPSLSSNRQNRKP